MAAFLASAALAAGCAAPKSYDENREALGRALRDLDGGDGESAHRTLEHLLVRTGSDPNEYAVQRFAAASLLARTHVLASLHAPFWTERAVDGIFQGERRRPSPVSHLMTATYYAGYSLAWGERAQRGPLQRDGKRLLPSELEEVGLPNLRDQVGFLLLYALARLRFGEQIEVNVRDQSDFSDFAAVERRLDAAAVPASVRPWVHLALFDLVRLRDARKAFPFAIYAIEHAAETGGSLDDEDLEPVKRWITKGQDYKFVCPTDDAEIVLDSPRCTSCTQTRLMDFVYARRSEDDPRRAL